ncbi:MAG: M28 family peptidase, partial [Thermoanaerobaculia bacterium]
MLKKSTAATLALVAVLAALGAEIWSARSHAGFAEREGRRVARLVDASRIERETARLAGMAGQAVRPGDAEIAKLLEARLAETGLKTWDVAFDAEVREAREAERGRRPLRNLFALLPGRDPDARPVLLGTHYDASGPGPSDSSSAAAILLESAEVLASIGSGGWKPERGLLFAFWDGGASGFLGSDAYVEQALRDRTSLSMAYVDVGSAAKGTEILARATPGLRGVLEEVLRAVPGSRAGTPSASGKNAFPLPRLTGDAAPFLGLTATPVVQLASASPSLLARVLVLFAGTLASAPVVPYRFTEISDDFRTTLSVLEARAASANDWVGALPGLEKALDGFSEAANRWDSGGPRLQRLSSRKAEPVNRLLEGAMDVFGPSGRPPVAWGRGSLLVGPESGDESVAAPHASLARALLARDFDAIRNECAERARALAQAQ